MTTHEARRDVAYALGEFNRIAFGQRRIADSRTYSTALSLAAAVEHLLDMLGGDQSDTGQFRVRMTAHGDSGVPIADRNMNAVPCAGDLINSADGTLRVDEVAWNFDPEIPCDIVLFIVSPEAHHEYPAEPCQAYTPGDIEDRHNCDRPAGHAGAHTCSGDSCYATWNTSTRATWGTEEPICKRCHQHHDLHDRDELACPLIPTGTGFSDTGRYTT